MKLLTEQEMLEIVEADEADRSRLAERMRPVLEAETAGWFDRAVQNKQLNVSTIVLDGRKLGAVWWFFSPGNKSVCFNAGASFVPDNTTPAFIAAYRKIAKSCGAVSVAIETRRAGLIKIYQKHGFKIEGVGMRLML